MRKLLLLALVAIFLIGCGPTQQKEVIQEKVDQETRTPILLRSISDDYLGFCEIDPDSLDVLVQNNDQNYHYYVYDSLNLIAEGFYDFSVDTERVCCYDCDKQWNRCDVLLFTDDANISKIQFTLSWSKDGIDLTDCAVSDNEGHKYWPCSENAISIIDRATSYVVFPIFEGYLDYLSKK